jgi:mono/diheme cytochrome c family protein
MFLSGMAGLLGCLALLLASCSWPGPSVEKGRALYFANGCASCHGSSGAGNGPLAQRLISKPTDLRMPALFKRGSGEDAIARTLAEGVFNHDTSTPPSHATHHELAMPQFSHLTDTERRSIALYVISLHAEGRS